MSFRLLILASLATVGLVFATAASASGQAHHGYTYGNSHHGHHGSHHGSSYSYGYGYRPGSYGHKSRYGYGGHRRSSYSYGRAYGGGNVGRSGYYSGGCKSVYKIDYWNGHKARIGGTECFDHYGNPYIVPGSRYIVEYLYY